MFKIFGHFFVLFFSIPQVVGESMRDVFGPFLSFGPPAQPDVDRVALVMARQDLIAHEGRRNDVYIDTEGHLTVGIGHKVLAADGLHLGQRISDAQVEAFFQRDINKAFSAAKAQALDLRKYTPEMIAALTSVNFQLGTGWRSKFPGTWGDLKNQNVQGAIARLKSSAWARQTPVRVSAFIETLREVYG